MGGSAEVLAVAQLYCGIRLAAMPIALANAVNLGFLLGCQRTGWTLNTQIASNVSHIILAYGLTVWFDLGIVGLAVAAVLADIVSLALTLLLAARQRVGHPHLHRVLQGDAIRRLLLANLDLLVRSLLMMIGLGWFTSTGAGLGDRFLAANALLLVFQNYLTFMVDGFSNAAQTLVGAAYGLRDSRAVRSTVVVAGVWTTLLGLAASALFLLLGPHLIGAMTNQESVRAAAIDHLHWMVIAPPVMAWAFLFDGLFLGALRTRELRNAMIVTIAVYSVAILTLPAAFANNGLWASYLILMGGRVVTLGFQWRRQPLPF
jgi:MATE family multidrug resistance protein